MGSSKLVYAETWEGDIRNRVVSGRLLSAPDGALPSLQVQAVAFGCTPSWKASIDPADRDEAFEIMAEKMAECAFEYPPRRNTVKPTTTISYGGEGDHSAAPAL